MAVSGLTLNGHRCCRLEPGWPVAADEGVDSKNVGRLEAVTFLVSLLELCLLAWVTVTLARFIVFGCVWVEGSG